MLHCLRNNSLRTGLLWLVLFSPLHASALQDARDALFAGDYSRAADLARAAVAESPTAGSWTVLGQALTESGNTVEAERAFREAIAVQPDQSLRARIALASLRVYGEQRDAARQELQMALDEYGDRTDQLRSPELQSLGDAARMLANRDASLFRSAVDFYRLAIERDADNLAARVALGDLLLEKHNNADALTTYRGALRRNEAYAPAILGLARSQHFDHQSAALATATASVEAQPTLIAAHTFIARLHLEMQDYELAGEHLATALTVNRQSMPALAMQAALYFLTDDQDQLEHQLQTLRELAPYSSSVYSLLAELAARTRRYRDAVNFALVGLTLDDTNWQAMAALGINRLRLGDMRSGRRVLEVAFKGDPFNVRVKNTLDLLDKLDQFETVRSERFVLLAERGRAELLAPYLLPIAEAAYDYYASRYAYQLAYPLRIEIYSDHADFSVRTVGLTGLDILGASFGPVVLLDSPRAGSFGAFNWASALWHEIAHSFHLAMSDYRAPRWFSEGLAVAEERLARAGWGGDVSPGFLHAYHTGKLRNASELEQAFLAPRFANEIPYTYYLASLLIERIESARGADMLAELLRGFAAGDTSMQAIAQRLGYTPEAFDQWLDDYARARFGHAIDALYPSGDALGAGAPYEELLGKGKSALAAGDLDPAREALSAAQALFPEHAGPESSYHDLAEIYRRQDDIDNAISQLQRNVSIDADDLDAHLQLAELYAERGDLANAEDIAERALLIQPFNAATHQRLAELYEARDEYPLAVLERRAVVSLDPEDPVQARYQLASTLHLAGEAQQAKTELL
ncbi:MAG: tetratricopeptide repeat protein, partial [Gammaproteobacteria bacterium]|nr:tetratricopeptide repeat protein [Gammaproteobacteria bacterium]